jgi:hypothetical protein
MERQRAEIQLEKVPQSYAHLWQGGTMTSYQKAMQEAKEEYQQWLAEEEQARADRKATRNIFRKLARGEYATA